jgi:hypothetical protein
MARSTGKVERLELFGDGVKPRECSTVVVLVVALDELHREIGERLRTAIDRLQLIAHDV